MYYLLMSTIITILISGSAFSSHAYNINTNDQFSIAIPTKPHTTQIFLLETKRFGVFSNNVREVSGDTILNGITVSNQILNLAKQIAVGDLTESFTKTRRQVNICATGSDYAFRGTYSNAHDTGAIVEILNQLTPAQAIEAATDALEYKHNDSAFRNDLIHEKEFYTQRPRLLRNNDFKNRLLINRLTNYASRFFPTMTELAMQNNCGPLTDITNQLNSTEMDDFSDLLSSNLQTSC